MNLSNTAIIKLSKVKLYIKSGTSKSEAIKLLQNIDSAEKSGTL